MEAEEPHSTDELSDAVVAFVQRADLELLPNIVSGLNALLELPPVLESPHSEISLKFMWLTIAALHAIERLMEARHPASLGSAPLAILHKLAIARGNGIGSYDETKFQFSTLVPAWPELNRASFWFEVGKARDGLTEFWQVYDSFCQFEKSDFEYAVKQIAERSLLDEKLLALSLAFYSYVKGGRDRRQRNKLKKVVAGHTVLAERLTGYLKPPAEGGSPGSDWKRNASDVPRP